MNVARPVVCDEPRCTAAHAQVAAFPVPRFRHGADRPAPGHTSMKLPSAWRAVVDRAKVIDYLLEGDHPDNGGKASFFARVGFTKRRWHILAAALRVHALEAEAAAARGSRHGEKYVLEARLRTPSGRRPMVRSVWIIDRGGAVPRLVTAYPVTEKSG